MSRGVQVHCNPLVPARILLAALTLAALAGCRGNIEVLETQLRHQEDQLRQTQRALTETRQELETARRESRQLQSELARVSDGAFAVEQVAFVARAEALEINQLLSGPLPVDDVRRSDESPQFKIVCYPKDATGDVLKVGGDFQVAMSWETPGGTVEPLGQWTFAADDAEGYWHSGFLGTGFHFVVPVHLPAAAESVDVSVKLETPDGRTFEAESRVRLLVPEKAGSAENTPGDG